MKEKLKTFTIIPACATYCVCRGIFYTTIAQGKKSLKKVRKACRKNNWNPKARLSRKALIVERIVLIYAVALIYAAATGIYYGSLYGYEDLKNFLADYLAIQRRKSFTVVRKEAEYESDIV